MKLFDLHCDTICELYRNKQDLSCHSTAFSLDKVREYERKYQVFAFWSHKDYTIDHFLLQNSYLEKIVKEEEESARIVNSKSDMRDDGKLGIIKAVEGAGLLSGSCEGVSVLREAGVKILLPLWGGIDKIGGAWDTSQGLTRFGKSLVREAEKTGIITDVSHMSEKSFYDTVNVSEKAIIASHSNSRTLCDTPRNLTDRQARIICEKGGIIGVSLVAKHLSQEYACRMPAKDEDFIGLVVQHIIHLVSVTNEDTLCIGSDFDGTEMSCHIPDVSYMDKLYARLADEAGKEVADKVFFENAYRFFNRNLK